MADTSHSRFDFLKHPLLWVLVAAVLRLAYLMEQQAGSVLFYQPLLDEQEMTTAARQLLSGAGFGHEPLFKAPLYPIYLAAVMFVSGEAWFFLARLLQHLLGAVLVLITYDVARRCAGAPRDRGSLAGALAAAAIAFYGPLIRLEDSLVLDFFAVWLQSAMIWALVRMRTTPVAGHEKKWAALAGLLAALALLNRPTLIPVLPLLGLWIIGWRGIKLKRLTTKTCRRRLVCAGLLLALPAAAMILVYLRNAISGGEGMVLPWQGGYSFYYANKAGANGRYFLQSNYALSGSGNPTRELAEAGWRNAMLNNGTSPSEINRRFHSIDQYWMDRAKQEIRQDPVRWLELMGRKCLYLFNDREIFNFEVYDVHKQMSAVLRRLPISFGVLWPLAFASLGLIAVWPRPRRCLLGLILLYAAALGGAIALYYTSGRLRMPLVFPAAVLAGSGVEIFLRQKFFQNNFARKFATGLCACGILMSWGDWWGVRSENMRHIEYARLSNAAWRSGENTKALEFAEACEREHPGYPSAALQRGLALYSLGRMPAAVAAFEESLRRYPEDPVAPFNLGIIAYYDQPDLKRAAALFDEALRRQPGYHMAAWMASLSRLRLGDLDRAHELMKPFLPLEAETPPDRLGTAAVAIYIVDKNVEEARKVANMIEKNQGSEGMKKLAEELKLLGLRTP